MLFQISWPYIVGGSPRQLDHVSSFLAGILIDVVQGEAIRPTGITTFSLTFFRERDIQGI